MLRDTKEAARGRWPAILPALGIDQSFLTGKHGPCPACGGKDRFRFDDKESGGEYYCSGCGAGDGFSLLMKTLEKPFVEVAKMVDGLCHLPVTKRKESMTNDEKRLWCLKAWQASVKADGTEVENYLMRRIGVKPPSQLRFNHSMYHKDEKREFPAMVARIINADGSVAGLHRTFLANIQSRKKAMSFKPYEGAAVRLSLFETELGIAEGIETALAAQKAFKVPCWAATTAGELSRWIPPDRVRRVVIFGDNDESFTGQAAAYQLAFRLKKQGLSVEVLIPNQQGKDWADDQVD